MRSCTDSSNGSETTENHIIKQVSKNSFYEAGFGGLFAFEKLNIRVNETEADVSLIIAA